MDIHGYTQGTPVKIRISKWGNSLGVRLPAVYTRALGIKAGDSVEAEMSPGGRVTLAPAKSFDKTAFLKRIQKLRSGMSMTSATVEAMRSEDRY
jgi:antitoxin MazE